MQLVPFNFDPEGSDESDEEQPPKTDIAVASTSRGRFDRRGGKVGVSTGKVVRRGRPKKLVVIPEESSDDEDFDCLDQMSSSSKSSWSSHN